MSLASPPSVPPPPTSSVPIILTGHRGSSSSGLRSPMPSTDRGGRVPTEGTGRPYNEGVTLTRARSEMLPLYHDPHFTFRFADDRLIPRFHLDGVEAGRRVAVYRI